MTKPRKPSEPETAAPEPSPTGTPRTVSKIEKLVARWNFLEADERYRASIADTEGQQVESLTHHDDEQAEIEDKLRFTQPWTLDDLSASVRFVCDRLVENRHLGFQLEVSMLSNVIEDIGALWRNDMEKARAEGRDRATDLTRAAIEAGRMVDERYPSLRPKPVSAKPLTADDLAKVEKARRMIVELDGLIGNLERAEA